MAALLAPVDLAEWRASSSMACGARGTLVSPRMKSCVRTAAPLLIGMLLSFLAGCATPRPPLAPSLELPKPVSDLHGTRKSDKVTLFWSVPVKTTDNTRVRHLGPILVCRSLEFAINRCDPVGTVEPASLPAPAPAPTKSKNGKTQTQPVQASYADVLLPKFVQMDPTGFATYAVSVQNTDLRSAGLSNQIRIPLVPTLPPPSDLRATVTSDGVTLTWTGVLPELQSPGVTYIYRIYRHDRASKASSLAGELPVILAAEPRFVDSGMEWQKTYDYTVTVVSVLNTSRTSVFQVEGDDSSSAQVVVNDTFPPAEPNGLQAVSSGEGQQPFIDLTWAPNTEADLDGYNVYRRQNGGAWQKINSSPVETPTFQDADVVRGTEYTYSVTAVDLRSNESSRSAEISESIH